MNRKVIKIKIGKENTTIYYSEKFFKNRVEAIKATISHLERLLTMYETKE